MAELEKRLNEEQRLRVLEMDEKARKVGELERDIATTIEQQMKEHAELKHRHQGLLDAYREVEHLVKYRLVPPNTQHGDTPLSKLIEQAFDQRIHEERQRIEIQHNGELQQVRDECKPLVAKVLRLREERDRLRQS